MKISVFVRGEVTTKIFQAWQLQVPKRFNGCSVSSCCNADSECIVVGKSCTVDTFSLWTNGTILNVSVAIVSPEWLITSLKQGKLLPPDDFRIPQLCKKNVEVPLQNSKTGETSSVSENLVECVRESQTEVDPAKESLTDVEGFSQSQPSQLQSSQTAAGAQPSAISNNVESANQNEHITNMLDQLQAMYLQMGDQFRAQNYKKASATLKRIPRVSSVKDLEGRQGFGKSIKTSIAEILETGSLLKLKHLKKNPRSSAITLLSDIWGVGEKTAEQLYNQGFNNVSDIRSRGKHLLNRQQLIGLEYYEEFLTKIPRDEVGEIYRIVCEECLKIAPEAELTVCGSYRRGKSECGDVDILITPQEGAPFDNLPAHTLSRLLLALERCKFLTDHLSLPTGHKAFVQSSALEQIRHVQAHTDGSGGSGGGSSSTKSGSRASRAGSVHSSKSRVSQFLNSPPRTTNTQDHQHEPQQDFVSPTRRSFGLTQLADIPEASSECDNEDEQFLSDEDGDLPSGSEASGAESGREQLSGAEDGDRDVGGEGYGTQSDMEAAGGGDGEGGDDAQAVKYDTYGGKRKKTTHRLYFGSRSSYMGVCQVPHPGALHRRIDIKIYPRSQRAFALFYFTGSDSFNRGVRYYVAKNGYALDDKGLMRCVRDEKNKIVTRGELIPCASERAIFERLGLAYKEPWERPMFDFKTMILRPLSDNPANNWYGHGLGNGKGYRFGLRPAGSNSTNKESANNVTILPGQGRALPSEASFAEKDKDKAETSTLGKRPFSSNSEEL